MGIIWLKPSACSTPEVQTGDTSFALACLPPPREAQAEPIFAVTPAGIYPNPIVLGDPPGKQTASVAQNSRGALW